MITNTYKSIHDQYLLEVGNDEKLKNKRTYIFIYKNSYVPYIQDNYSDEKQREKWFNHAVESANNELLRINNEKEFEYPPIVIVKYPDLSLPIWQTLTYDN